MTTRTRAQLNGDADTNLADNTIGSITPAKLRQRIKDLADSAKLAEDLAAVASTGAYADLTGKPTLGSAAALTAGTASGNVPVLDGGGKIPAAVLPAYVDDVLEYANVAAFPVTGTAGLLYVALDTNKISRWSGSAYIEIAASPGSTDVVTEGTTNKYYTDTRVRAAVLTGLSLVTGGAIAATDTVLAAFGKLQKQITDLAVATIVSWGAITRAAGFDTFVATPSSANLRALMTDETGSGALVFGTSPTLATPNIDTINLTGGQIVFPATDAPSSNANTLDDYEEGTFTPTMVGSTLTGVGTYTAQVGKYTKVGNLVSYVVNVAWTAHTATGTMTIGGLPFTTVGTGVVAALFLSGITYTNSPQAWIPNASNVISIEAAVTNAASAPIAVDTVGNIRVSGQLFTT